MKQQLEDRLIELRLRVRIRPESTGELETKHAELENKKRTSQHHATHQRCGAGAAGELEKERKSNETGQLRGPIGGIHNQEGGIGTG